MVKKKIKLDKLRLELTGADSSIYNKNLKSCETRPIL